jgi:predicted transcriptional regulator
MGITVSDISKSLGVARHRVAYAIRVLGLQPAQTAGVVRVYDPSILSVLSAELNRRRLRSAISG